MAEIIVMPKIAMGQTEGQVIDWSFSEGDWVDEGQVVMVMETEKVTYDCESPASGYLHIMAESEKIYPVGTTVAFLAADEKELAQLQAEQPRPIIDSEKKIETSEKTPLAKKETVSSMPTPHIDTVKQGKIKISPVSRNKAKAHNLDISKIAGTGIGGRIVIEDIERALEAGETARTPGEQEWSGEMLSGKRIKATLPLKGMRKAIANHMTQSLAVSAQMGMAGEIKMTEFVKLREKLLKKEDEIGARITYTDLLIMVLVKAVEHVPQVNASLIDDEIKIWEDINVGIAVALELGDYESGLIVPVLKNAESKTLVEISRSIRDLSSKARNGNLSPEDVDGGTITLSNVGRVTPGWSVSTPILNQHQAVIIQPGGIFDRPVAMEGQVVVRPIMTLSITFDHRILDGVPVAKFYAKIKELIENPDFLHF
jgi:pyruvate dehydrogenase E2 component (dihydrolipoamide acetyltransferase)